MASTDLPDISRAVTRLYCFLIAPWLTLALFFQLAAVFKQTGRGLYVFLIIANLVHTMKTTREEAVIPSFQTDKTDVQVIFVEY